MRVVIDVEANGLENPTKVWVVVCKDIDTGDFHIFRELDDAGRRREFLHFCSKINLFVGHNWLGYDYPVLNRLVGLNLPNLIEVSIDTLIVSKLVDYSREAHSVEQYGEEFGYPKIAFSDFSKYSKEMEDYCVRDVEITLLIYQKYLSVISDNSWEPSIRLEHEFQLVVNDLHNNGFSFNTKSATALLSSVVRELGELDKQILNEFPPKLKPIREVHPKVTKHGTLSRTDFRFVKDGDLSDYNGGPFTRCSWVTFNPSSHKQLVEVLHDAGWKPVDKTQTHIELERELQRSMYPYNNLNQVDIEAIRAKLLILGKYGYKINENNLSTLPEDAPSPARSLAKRILLESRRRTLTEWLSLVSPQGRIHGKFYGIGAWTHRMAHQNPNTANIPTGAKLFGHEMRALWCAPKNKLLVGVDAEGIQLRIFAHYINDPEFTASLVKGKKDDKTDPHSLNQRILGRVCKSRAAAKRFIYALLLGAGIGKLAEILETDRDTTQKALRRLLERYKGFAYLKREVLPLDGERGYFIGLDGRKVSIPGENASARTHLAMSGYLQNGEAVVMKKACLLWHQMLHSDAALAKYIEDIGIVNFVHDEWQTEVPNNIQLALKVAKIQADSLQIVGEQLKLNCPLAGSYWNEDHKDYTIGVNWSQTH